MRIFSDFSEFKAAVGTEIGVSEWVEITQDRIDRFAEATCDEQWSHDPHRRHHHASRTHGKIPEGTVRTITRRACGWPVCT